MTKEPSTEQQIVSCGEAGLRVVAVVVPAAVTGALALLRAGRPRSLSACLLACAFILLRLIMRLFSSDSFVYFSFFLCVCLVVCVLAYACPTLSVAFASLSSPPPPLRICACVPSPRPYLWPSGELDVCWINLFGVSFNISMIYMFFVFTFICSCFHVCVLNPNSE